MPSIKKSNCFLYTRVHAVDTLTELLIDLIYNFTIAKKKLKGFVY